MPDWLATLPAFLARLDPAVPPEALLRRIWPDLTAIPGLDGIWLQCLPGHLQPAGVSEVGSCPDCCDTLAAQAGPEAVRQSGDGFLASTKLHRDGNVTIATLVLLHDDSCPEAAIDLIHAGLGRYLTDRLRLQLEACELAEENQHLRESLRPRIHQHDLVAISGTMERLIETAMRSAASNATVLILGETGTGKELLARLVHAHSPRSTKPLISVNAGALSQGLLESELFGHRKGSFTGADRDRQGLFEVANGGSLFLDEVGELTPGAQVRLLRVLQERCITRVGDHRVIPVDVRVIAATHRDLQAEVVAGRFRQDLFYRLNVVGLAIPPLRDRQEDIPPLVEHFLARYNRENFKQVEVVPPRVLRLLQAYAWPGNIRELENCIQKAVVMAQDHTLGLDLLPHRVRSCEIPEGRAVEEGDSLEALDRAVEQFAREHGPDLHRFIVAAERRLIIHALNHQRGVKLRAARRLGINRVTLDRKLVEHGLVVRRGQGVVEADSKESDPVAWAS